MNNGSTFYVGPPTTTYTTAATKQEPQVTGGEQNPVSTQEPGTTHNYFVGPPANSDVRQAAPAPLPPPPPPPPAARNRSGFLAKWFPCISGGGASSEQ